MPTPSTDAAPEETQPALVRRILETALEERATDLHLQPEEGFTRVKFRILGRLEERMRLSAESARPVVARFLELAGVAPHLPTGSGRFTLRTERGGTHFRLSLLPALHGPSLHLGVQMEPSGPTPPPADPGFDGEDLERLEKILGACRGLLLVSGPPGSGKSRTLAACLARLRTGDRHLVTVEDPVAQPLPGVTQIQVDEPAGLTPARLFRTLLAHDPDVILSGATLDPETVRLMTQAACSGRMVLAAATAPSARETVAQWMGMGIPEPLLGHNLAGVIHQRLTPALCRHCRLPHRPSPGEAELLAPYRRKENWDFWRKGEGCGECDGTGYDGRVLLYEFLTGNALVRVLAGEEPGAEHVTLARRAVARLRSGEADLADIAPFLAP